MVFNAIVVSFLVLLRVLSWMINICIKFMPIIETKLAVVCILVTMQWNIVMDD